MVNSGLCVASMPSLRSTLLQDDNWSAETFHLKIVCLSNTLSQKVSANLTQMARNGRPDEWSCPLCTLINAWRDRRCAACDNERPADLLAQPTAASPAAAAPVRAAQPRLVYREAPGVFFSSAAPAQGSSTAWRQETRLAVNRRTRKRGGQWSAADAQQRAPAVLRNELEGSTATTANRDGDEAEEESKPVAVMNAGGASEDPEEVDVPCFNLLGLAMGMLGAEEVDTPAPERRIDHSPDTEIVDVDTDYGMDSNTAPAEDRRIAGRPVGFVPASRVYQEEVEEKLANAGLDLSDSDDSDTEVTRLRRKNRPLSPSREIDVEPSGPSWECPVCTNFNAPSLTSCDLCDTPKARDDECSICSKILRPDADKCDRCGTLRAPEKENDFIDLASSPNVKRPANPRHNNGYDSDFENPYAPIPYDVDDDYPQYAGDMRGAYGSVEEISDNEPIPSYTRPQHIRPELKEFEHFVSVEDLRGDYGCKVDYQSMFTGGRTGKSYADRLAARRRESQKRKREAAKRDDDYVGTAAPKQSRSRKSAGPKKAAASRRRASTGAKRQRKGGTQARRASAPAPTPPPAAPVVSSVNYYDSNSIDFGEDVRTMAWEGVGSASYY